MLWPFDIRLNRNGFVKSAVQLKHHSGSIVKNKDHHARHGYDDMQIHWKKNLEQKRFPFRFE